MKTTQSPCSADALFGTKTVTVAGKAVGIAGLCDAIADVRAMALDRNDALKAALLARVAEENYIPETLAGEYAEALLAEYQRTLAHGAGGGRS